jgi:putative transposase
MASVNSFAVLEWIRKIQGEENLDFLRELLKRWLFSGSSRRKRRRKWALSAMSAAKEESHIVTATESDLDTRLGTIELSIPKLRQGSFFPSILSPGVRQSRRLWRWYRRPM